MRQGTATMTASGARKPRAVPGMAAQLQTGGGQGRS